MIRWRVLLALAAVMYGAPAWEAQARHCFAVWKYPYPQRCSVSSVAQDQAKVWYVELTGVQRERTPEEEADQREHDIAVAQHKDELNSKLDEVRELERWLK